MKHAYNIDTTVQYTTISSLCTPLCATLKEVVKHGTYDSAYASLHCVDDAHTQVFALAKKLKHQSYGAIFVVGIGGSNLGTQALDQALQQSTIPLYFADTMNVRMIHALQKKMVQVLHANKRVLLVLISKSGTTTETIANGSILLRVLKEHLVDYHKDVVMITDQGSSLWEYGYEQLSIPKLVGGRYSVFSAVGMFPLLMAGYDIKQILAGARKAQEDCIKPKNEALYRASILYHYYTQHIRIHDMFLFDTHLEGIGKWYRQLVGESLGKGSVGITPTVSLGTTDLHSVGQLYLGGPLQHITTFVSVDEHAYDYPIDGMNILPQLQGRTLHTVLLDTLAGVKKAYEKQQRSYMHIALPRCDGWHLGYLLQMLMLETMFLGHLLGVNAFDQPHVELYKQETRKILENN
ncbi:MAG: hypothetical protein ACMXYC_02150 [Candidatus Woesearchaeota archaeon]